MKRYVILSLLLILLLIGCTPDIVPDNAPAQPDPIEQPVSDKRCGDGVCDGPENITKCPEDCTSTQQPSLNESSSPGESKPIVYLTFTGHIEDRPLYSNCDVYLSHRDYLISFAELISKAQAKLNLQIEYEFFEGALNCETEEVMAATDGRNIVDYLAVNYGIEIDPHQEGGWDEGDDTYADIRYLGGQITSKISEVVGGFVWNDSSQFAKLEVGRKGSLHPDFIWYPKILTMGTGPLHHQGNFSDDDYSSGVWIPNGSGENFKEHNANGGMVYVGPGVQHGIFGGCKNTNFANPVDYVKVLIEYMQNGQIDGDKIYTTSIGIPQSVIFDPNEYKRVQKVMDQLAPLVTSGRVIYVTYSEVVDIWRTQYNAEPNIYTMEMIDPGDFTCP
jgi:hypothetical protein